MSQNKNEQLLLGRGVLVTRPAHQVEDFAEKIRRVGGVPLCVPAIALSQFSRETPEGIALREAVDTLGDFDWIIFTSVNGVEAFMTVLAEAGKTTEALATSRLAVIGPSTADRLCEYGVAPHVMPEEFISDAIPEVLGEVAGNCFLLPRADIARKWLPEELKRRGGVVQEVPTYRVVPNEEPKAIEHLSSLARPDYITVTSSSIVRGLRGLLEKSGRLSWFSEVPVVSIGPVTSETARECGATTIITAKEFTTDGIVEAMIQYEQESGHDEKRGE